MELENYPNLLNKNILNNPNNIKIISIKASKNKDNTNNLSSINHKKNSISFDNYNDNKNINLNKTTVQNLKEGTRIKNKIGKTNSLDQGDIKKISSNNSMINNEQNKSYTVMINYNLNNKNNKKNIK